VLFDMDGVLVDSSRAHYKSWLALSGPIGRTMTVEQFNASFGRTSREILRSLWPELHLEEKEIAALDARKEAAFREILAADFPAMPGARGLLRRLKDGGVPVAIGSSGPPENVDLTLDRLGVRTIFAAVVTGMDVTRGKPDPQVFLLAAQRLGIPPRRCVVVEDAPLGIEAARRAGMASVGLASTGRTRQALRRADLVVDRLDGVSPRVFRELVAKRSLGCPSGR
jgi:beta-phosphoglucomutase